jgi:hypothetical protein
MKRFTSCICILLVCVMLFSTTAFAAESRASNFFAKSSVYFWRSSGNNYQIWFDVTGKGTMTELGASEIIVERSTDLSNWSTVCTYYKSNYSQMTDSNTVHYANYVPFTATDGYYYRAHVFLYARNSSGTGNMIETTAVLNLR